MLTTILIITAIAIGLGVFLRWATLPVTFAFRLGRDVQQIAARHGHRSAS